MNVDIDRFGALGAVVGAYIVLAALALVVGMPWQYSQNSGLVAVLNLVGALAAIGVGAGLVWLALRAR